MKSKKTEIETFESDKKKMLVENMNRRNSDREMVK